MRKFTNRRVNVERHSEDGMCDFWEGGLGAIADAMNVDPDGSVGSGGAVSYGFGARLIAGS